MKGLKINDRRREVEGGKGGHIQNSSTWWWIMHKSMQLVTGLPLTAPVIPNAIPQFSSMLVKPNSYSTLACCEWTAVCVFVRMVVFNSVEKEQADRKWLGSECATPILRDTQLDDKLRQEASVWLPLHANSGLADFEPQQLIWDQFTEPSTRSQPVYEYSCISYFPRGQHLVTECIHALLLYHGSPFPGVLCFSTLCTRSIWDWAVH